MRKSIFYPLLLLVFAVSAVVGDLVLTSEAERAARLDRPSPVGAPFALTDQTGRMRRSEEFRGRYMLVFFGYTHCPDICPATLQNVSDALDKLPKGADRIQPVFVAVDPARDTPARLAEFAKSFNPRIVMLTGEVADLRRLAKGYKAYFSYGKKKADGSYPVTHTATVFLMGPDGRYLDHFGPEVTPDKLARALARYVAPTE